MAQDKFHFVVYGQRVKVFEAKGVSSAAGTRALDVDDLVNSRWHPVEWSLAGRFQHQGETAPEQPFHEGQQLLRLEHGFAAGELYEFAGGQGLDAGYDFILGVWFAAGEGVLGVAPGAAEVAAGEADEDAREAGEAALALDGFVELYEIHALEVVAGEAGVGLVESAVLDLDSSGGHVVELGRGLLVEVTGKILG